MLNHKRFFRLVSIAVVMTIGVGLALDSLSTQTAYALPGTLTVNTTSVTNDPNDGKCDLWEALQAVFQANFGLSPTYNECTAVNGTNVIVFGGSAAGGTITIPLPGNPQGYPTDLPFVWGDTTIQGPITVNGGGPTSELHVFRLAGDTTLTLIDVTIKDAHTSGFGPAIYNDNHSTVNLISSSIIGNNADNGGGAVTSNGTLNIALSNFSGNTAHGDSAGSGIGGAIHYSGSGAVSIAQSNFAGNITKNGGGAIWLSLTGSDSTATIQDTVFNGNIVNGGSAGDGGGAIYNNSSSNEATLNINRTAFSANLSPDGDGGAIYNGISASTWITDTSFNGNVAGSPTQAQLGGAIYEQSKQFFIARSAFIGNSSITGDGGALAIDRSGTATVANTTFTGNNAPLGFGGAIVVTNTQTGGPQSALIAKNVTLATNAAKPPSDHGGNLYVGAGHAASVGNSIFDGGISGNCVGTVTSLGHNLDSGTGCNFNQAGDIDNGNANLDSPGFNGGPITSLLTQKLLAGSAAIDAGDNTLCANAPVNNEDQRGESRPKDGDGNISATCDIGAYESDTLRPEYGSSPVQPGPINIGNTTFGTTITNTFDAFNTGDITLTLIAPSLGGANAGQFGIVTAFPVNLASGATKSIVLSCTPVGPTAGTRTATLTFATNDLLRPAVLYNLTCNAAAAPAPGFGSDPIAPGPIEFAETIVGHTSNAVIQINETGNTTLTVSSLLITGPNVADFATTTSFPIQIGDNGAPKNLTLTCTPGDVGVRSATATLSTNDPNHSSVTYNLICTGIPVPPPAFVPGASVDNTPERGLDGVYGVAVSPDGKNVYATSYLSGTVTSFTRNATSGSLTFISQHGAIFNQLDGARLIAMSPDGNNAYVAANPVTNGTVIQLDRDPVTGDMTAVHGNGRADLATAYGVAVSPDGRFVYATGNASDSVVVFSRNTTSGDLSYVQTIISTTINGPRGLTVSPDGLNLYVTAYPDSAHGTLEVFKRNVIDGKLTHVQTRFQGDCIDAVFICIFGLDGLKGAFQVVVSPDNAHVYAVGTYSGAIVAFKRNLADGKLKRIATYTDNTNGIDGLDGVSGIDITPDGVYVVATGYNDKAVAVFTRDAISGQLTFSQMIQRNPFSGAGGNPPLSGGREVRISPDGKNVYAAAFLDDSVAVLRKGNPVALIDNLSPASKPAGSGAFTLTVNGDDFIPGSVVRWNGANRTTTFVTSHELKANINASDLASAGAIPIRVHNNTPGGGDSNVLTFTVTAVGQNPVPTLDHLSPAGVLAGSAAFTLDVYGASFTSSSTGVMWNNVVYLAQYIDSTHLRFQVPASFVAQPGAAGVAVFTTSPGGGKSNVLSFDIAAPGQNPAPSMTSLGPNWVFSLGAGSPQFTLVVTGTNFVDGATVQWNGADRPTKFLSSTKVRATIYGADQVFPGFYPITVKNPSPGGGTSNSLPFEVKQLFRVYVPMLIK